MDAEKSRSRGYQFSLRALLLLMLVSAAFLGGWVANELKHKYAVKDDVLSGNVVFRLDATVTDTLVVRGKKSDVDKTIAVIETISESAQGAAESQDSGSSSE